MGFFSVLDLFKADEHSQTVQHSRLLEVHNQQLQTSLFDIAQIVLDDADRDDSGSGVAVALGAAADNNVSTATNNTSVIKSTSSPLIRAAR